jgi:hypothetical protein
MRNDLRNPTSWSRIAWLTGGSIVVLLVLTTGVLLFGRTTPGEIDSLLQDAAPIGSDFTRIVDVLDSLGVEHSGYQEVDQVIYAVWRRTSVSLFHETAIQVQFLFDARGKLIRYELEESVSAT